MSGSRAGTLFVFVLLVVAVTALLAGDARSASGVTGMIAFTRIEDGGIYLVRSTGGEIAMLARVGTETRGEPQNLEWAPDGSKLAFESGGRIWVLDADGSDLTSLTWSGRRAGDLVRRWAMSPSWSPNGRRIAYTLGERLRYGGGVVDRDVWVMNADGSDKRRLARTADCAESFLDWSPRGGRLVTQCEQGPMVMNVAGGDARRLLPGSPPVYSLDWAPDGRRIVFFGFTRVGRGISVLDADSGSLVRLTSAGDEPAWSPDGRRIAFARRGAVRTGIYVMKPDGTGVTRLTSGRHFGPAWQPTSAP